MGSEPLDKRPLIYSIDDDTAMNRLMEARFTKFGCEIRTFTDPAILMQAIRDRQPKLIVIDLNLGEGLSGLNIIETVRFEFKLEIPIIVVSSESHSSTVAHALEIGATDFVAKPPFRYQFEEKVAEYIQTSSLPDPPSSTLFQVKTAQPAKVSFQLAIEEVNPLGFTLASTHLIKKGSAFWLSGEDLKKIVPSVDNVFVTVLGSAAQIEGNQRLYQIRVEVDTSQETIIRDIKNYLYSTRINSSEGRP